jgi:hydroxymethylglutaryl-CoA reductase (NADPH)
MNIPSLLLRQLYTFGSLENGPDGFRFRLKNRLSDARLLGIAKLAINGDDVPLGRVTLSLDREHELPIAEVTSGAPVDFPLRCEVELRVHGRPLERGRHHIAIAVETEPFGHLSFDVDDAIREETAPAARVPCDKDDNTSPEIVRRRQAFVAQYSGAPLRHVTSYSFDPALTRGNIENFTGVAQVPLAFVGPLRVNGEHARGEFLIPLATTEGTMAASYSRGIKAVNASGGVTCTVSEDCMQRAPVFVFASARQARDFRDWVADHLDAIRAVAEGTSAVARLRDIETYLSNHCAYLRFNYTTGDAAGQNMVGRATFAACSWILDHATDVRRFYLESNLATDKKSSQINSMRTRGKRVTAEVTIPRKVVGEQLRIEPETLVYHAGVSTLGAFLSGANNNGAHSANAVTAMFIATGQDAANVAESSAGILYTEVTTGGDLFMSLTIPSLIVATHGGGTGLPTQRECLEVIGCFGAGKVRKLAEIVAGVALAGEISLGAAISSLDWVSSHEKYGRNR